MSLLVFVHTLPLCVCVSTLYQSPSHLVFGAMKTTKMGKIHRGHDKDLQVTHTKLWWSGRLITGALKMQRWLWSMRNPIWMVRKKRLKVPQHLLLQVKPPEPALHTITVLASEAIPKDHAFVSLDSSILIFSSCAWNLHYTWITFGNSLCLSKPQCSHVQ